MASTIEYLPMRTPHSGIATSLTRKKLSESRRSTTNQNSSAEAFRWCLDASSLSDNKTKGRYCIVLSVDFVSLAGMEEGGSSPRRLTASSVGSSRMTSDSVGAASSASSAKANGPSADEMMKLREKGKEAFRANMN
eukprot:3074894-Rhodomonas_salina.1